MKRRALVVIACALLAPAVPGGQTPASQQPPPTFRAETRAIDVDAVVTDRDGAFVRGLARQDFELLEDGQPQDIAAFTLVDIPIDTPTPRGKGQAITTVVSSDVTTNAIEGRIYVMLLDSPGVRIPERAHVSLEQMFRLTQQIATRFVDEALGPNDLMAVIHVQDWRGDAQGLTTNKALLRASIGKLKPDIGMPPGSNYCIPERLRTTYEVIETVAERLGSVTGRRKAILWVNGRVPLDPNDTSECGLKADDPTAAGLNSAQVSALAFMQRDAMRAATRSNVAIYPIDPVGLTADPPKINPAGGERVPGGVPDDEPKDRPMKRLAALRGIADDTGGEAVVNTNNFSPAFERIVRANSSYYLLGYRPKVDHRDGKLHTITVRVKRNGLFVRARNGYLAPGSEPPLGATLLPGVSAAGASALAKAIPENALGLRMFLAPFKGGANNGSVVLGAELRGLSGDPGAERRVEISYVAIDPQGGTRAAPPKTLPVSLAPGVASLTTDTAIRFVDRLALPPGRHEVRMAIHQPGGATGSIVAHVEVPDVARDPLALSGAALASADESPQATLQGDPALRGLLGAEPTTTRRFTRRDTLTAYVEAYTDVQVSPDDVTMAAALTNGQGAPVRKETASRVVADPGRSGFVVRLPLADLAPGEYVLTLEAKTGRRTATRQVVFEVRSTEL